MDSIIIKGLKIYAYHGVNPEEKEEGQNFIFDIKALLYLKEAAETDNLEDTVSYAKIIKTVKRVVLSEKNDLLERVAGRIAHTLFEEYEPIQELKIKVKKPEAPIKADFDYVAVKLTFKR